MAGAVRGEIYVAVKNRLAARRLDNICGEFVGHFSRPGLIEAPGIAISDQLRVRRGGLADVENPTLQEQIAVLRGGETEGKMTGVRGRIGPVAHPTAPSRLRLRRRPPP